MRDKLELIKNKRTLLKNAPVAEERLTDHLQSIKHNEIYNSLALLGNPLSSFETWMLIHEGTFFTEQSAEVQFQTLGYSAALDFIYVIANEQNRCLTIADIFDIHRLLTGNWLQGNSGNYRSSNILTGGSMTTVPDYNLVPQLINDFIADIDYRGEDIDYPLWVADKFIEFLLILPFTDSNNQTGKLIFNYLFLSKGYPVVTFNYYSNKKRYITDLSNALLLDKKSFIYDLILDSILESFDRYSEYRK